MVGPKWNEPQLQVESDDARRRSYRSLQSWYRETKLDLAAGSSRKRLVGSMLPKEAGNDANFLSPAIARYVDERVPVVQRAGGTLDPKRLRFNMLSSMPLCFNLFGELRANLPVAGRVLATALDLTIAKVTAIEVEWTPQGVHPLGDRTAFDAVVFYEDTKGRRGLVGVETKYTEPFSAERYLCGRYEEVTGDGAIFQAEAAKALREPATNQAWRNLMLAIEVAKAEGCELHHMAIVALAEDSGADEAYTGVKGQLVAPQDWLRRTSLEAIVAGAKAEPELAAWAARFETRYLDLSPIRAR